MNLFAPLQQDRRALPGRPIQRMPGWVGGLIFLLAMPQTAYAQIEDRTWIGAGLGVGTVFEEDGGDDDEAGALTATLYASYQTGAHVFSLRTAVAGELFGDTAGDLGVLYGRAITGEHGHASFGVGLAVVFVDYNPDGLFTDPDEGRDESVRAVGVPVEVQVFWRSLPFLGLGVYGFANVNPEASFAGVAFGLQLGDLR